MTITYLSYHKLVMGTTCGWKFSVVSKNLYSNDIEISWYSCELLSTSAVENWWNQLEAIAASQYHSGCRWQCTTLWMTLTRLWWHSFLLCLFWFGWHWHNVSTWHVIVEFSLQSHWYLKHPRQCNVFAPLEPSSL